MWWISVAYQWQIESHFSSKDGFVVSAPDICHTLGRHLWPSQSTRTIHIFLIWPVFIGNWHHPVANLRDSFMCDHRHQRTSSAFQNKLHETLSDHFSFMWMAALCSVHYIALCCMEWAMYKSVSPGSWRSTGACWALTSQRNTPFLALVFLLWPPFISVFLSFLKIQGCEWCSREWVKTALG